MNPTCTPTVAAVQPLKPRLYDPKPMMPNDWPDVRRGDVIEFDGAKHFVTGYCNRGSVFVRNPKTGMDEIVTKPWRKVARPESLREALDDCLQSLKRLPDVDGAFRATCIQQAEKALNEAKGQP